MITPLNKKKEEEKKKKGEEKRQTSIIPNLSRPGSMSLAP